MGTVSRSTPQNNSYTFKTYSDPELRDHEWREIDDAQDAEWFEEQDHFDVEWTAVGRLKSAADSVTDAVSDLSYNAKQQLVGEDEFDLDVAGNASDDELEQALREHVEELEDEGGL